MDNEKIASTTKSLNKIHAKNRLKSLYKAAVIIFAAALVLLIIMLKPIFFKQPIFVFGYSVCVVATSSMAPVYPASSLIILKKTSVSSLKEGDVVAFKSDALGGDIALHRIIKTVEDGFFTKGDQNPYSDGQLITTDKYVGKCMATQGLPIKFITRLMTAKGVLLYVFCPLIAVWAAVKAKKVFLKLNE